MLSRWGGCWLRNLQLQRQQRYYWQRIDRITSRKYSTRATRCESAQTKTYFSHSNNSIKNKKSIGSYKKGYSVSRKCHSNDSNKAWVPSDQWEVLAGNKARGRKHHRDTMLTNLLQGAIQEWLTKITLNRATKSYNHQKKRIMFPTFTSTRASVTRTRI